MEIFVGNLSFDLTKAELLNAFSEYGEITNVRMLFDAEGRFRGIAYLDFTDDTKAKEAISKMSGVVLNGRPMKVDYSRPARPSFNGFGAGFKNRRKKFFSRNKTDLKS